MLLRGLVKFKLSSRKATGKATLLVGLADKYLVHELEKSTENFRPVAFLEESSKNTKLFWQSLPVLRGIDKLNYAIDKYNIKEIIITKKLNKADLLFVYNNSETRGINCRLVPSLSSLLKLPQKKNFGLALREMKLEELLERKAVQLKTDDIKNVIANKSILVTGAGGSIGSELCRQLVPYGPASIMLLEISENALYKIDYELRNNVLFESKVSLASLVGNICDEFLLEKIFHENDIQIILHCAAYKHVPLMELNYDQVIYNNLIGTVRLAQAACRGGVERFVMLSTDKAVNPASVMGASKRIAEIYLQNLARSSDTLFMTVRFGNVLGSQGSVIPLFAKQIDMGGPVTVTHPEITRYFMTISEAVGLVIQAGIMGKGGEIFILEMGEAIKIRELAENMIRYTGLRPYQDIMIQYTGLRPGEKLFEELILDKEAQKASSHEKIYISTGINLSLDLLNKQIKKLENMIAKCDRNSLDLAISEIIPEYRPAHRFYSKTDYKDLVLSE